MQTRHLIATAVERVAVLGGVHLVLVRQVLEVSAFGRCSARLLREQVVVERHLVQRAGVGDAAVPVGWHLLVGVYGGAALGIAALVGLQRVREIVCCLLGTGLATRSVQAWRWGWEAGRGSPGGAGSAAEARLSCHVSERERAGYPRPATLGPHVQGELASPLHKLA